MMRSALIAASTAATMTLSPATQPRQSGLDVASLDRAVRPQDDLYQFVNGRWLATAAIPEERVVYTAATELQDQVEQDLREIIEEIAAEPGKRPGSGAQQIGDLYRSILDTRTIEALGRLPLNAELQRIDAIRTTSDLAAAAGHLSATSTAGPFFSTVAIDPATGGRVVHVSQGGTLLPDREYYLSLAGDYPRIRDEYRDYLVRLFTLATRPDAKRDADAVVALEVELARAQWTQVESRDRARTTNPYTLDSLRAAVPGFDWRAWARPQGFDRARTIVIAQPTFFQRFAALIETTPIDVWKAWLAARYLTAMAPYVSEDFGMARFDFFGRVLSGQEEPRPRWRRGVSLVSEFLGDEIGRRYVQRHFPPESKARVQRMVDTILRAFRDAVREATWMSSSARLEALDKLERLSARIGYPTRWRRYAGLEIRADDLAGNLMRVRRHANAYRMARIGATGDREDWLMTPQTVNAYYSPAENEIVFPAAILQPPYFTASADDAINYGAIGAVIGHEIGHALDDRGRRYDARGRARDWWTAEDERAYAQVTQRLIEQYYGYQPLPGMRVNGALTLAENAGDLAGLAIAFRAYRLSLGGRRAPVIDGFTGEQRFFLGWARIWRAKERDEHQRQMLLHSPYAPSRYRANGPLGHVDGFYDAFALAPGDALYRRAAARVRIW